jgi:hypothetical protein
MNKSAAPQIISLSAADLEKLLGELRGPFVKSQAVHHAAAVPKVPQSWLPWNYEQAIAAAGCG